MGSIGSRQGDINVMIPSRKEAMYCIMDPPVFFSITDRTKNFSDNITEI